MRAGNMTMQHQLFLKAALNPTMKDISELTMKQAFFMCGDGTASKPECKSSLLMEDVGEIEIDQDGDEDCVGFHPLDTASIFRARPEAYGETPLSRPICKAVSISEDLDSWNEDVTAPLPMHQGLPPSDTDFLTELRESGSSSPPSDLPSIIVLHPFSSSPNIATTLAFSRVSSPSRLDYDSDDTITTTTSGKHDLDDPMIAPQQQRWKRHKGCPLSHHPEPVQEEKQKDMKMIHCDFKELLPCGSRAPTLLEIAVGYGYHLARCRMLTAMNEADNAELSGILDSSRRVQEILQYGAQTVVRMKDRERLLFWRYMSESSSSSSPSRIFADSIQR